MANFSHRVQGNASGAWYVDQECIDCDLCRVEAPTVFRRDDELGQSQVYHQPEDAEEAAAAEAALQSCPVDAIGKDGDPAPGSRSQTHETSAST